MTGNLVPCLSGVVGDIRKGKAPRVRKSRNHLLPLRKRLLPCRRNVTDIHVNTHVREKLLERLGVNIVHILYSVARYPVAVVLLVFMTHNYNNWESYTDKPLALDLG